MKTAFKIAFGLSIGLTFTASTAWCEPKKEIENNELDIHPEVIKNSPVLQQWRLKIPNVLQDINNEPSFPTRLRFGYSQLDGSGGVKVGFEDIFIVDKLTLRGEYEKAFNNSFENYGADLNYYLLPLGGYLNFSPVIGYRYLHTSDFTSSGANLGVKLLLVLSRGGGADIAFTRSWISLGTSEEVALTKLSTSYAITDNLRFSTELGQQKSSGFRDRQVGFFIEWMR
ncbi:MAG: hypothetical protein AAFQ91_12865 [Cyanobacteria bacterium J06621_15]